MSSVECGVLHRLSENIETWTRQIAQILKLKEQNPSGPTHQCYEACACVTFLTLAIVQWLHVTCPGFCGCDALLLPTALI